MRTLLSIVYSWFISRRNKGFDRGDGVKSVGVPVISVGNLSMGGSGKTPLVATIVQLLRDAGRRPAIVSRGYGRRSRGVMVVSDGQSILSDVTESGDELMMLARRFPSVVVVASELRLHGASRAVREYNVDCIVLDDGFQHRQLHRDVDIVVVDRSTLDNPKVVPAGVLREPLSGMQRADVICCSPGVRKSELVVESTTERFELEVRCSAFVRLDLHTRAVRPERVVAFCAIGEPDRFVSMLKNNHVDCRGVRYFRDHHQYTSHDIDELIGLAKSHSLENLVTTEKDAVKLVQFEQRFMDASLSVVVMCIESKPDSIEHFNSLIQAVFQPTRSEHS